MKAADFHGELEEGTFVKDSGFIAQEVEQTDELKHAVAAPEDAEDKYKLHYNQIFVHTTVAVQELISRVIALEARLAALEG